MKGATRIPDLVQGLGLAWPVLEHRHVEDAMPKALGGWSCASIGPAWALGLRRPLPDQPRLNVRWQVSPEQRMLRYHCPEHAWWVERIVDRSGLARSVVEQGMYRTLGAIAEAAAFIEARVFTMEGNWLLKRWNEPLTGSLRTFHLWLAWQQVADEDASRQVLTCCMAECAPDVDLSCFHWRSNAEVMAAFVQHFYHGRNDLEALRAALRTGAEAI